MTAKNIPAQAVEKLEAGAVIDFIYQAEQTLPGHLGA